MEQEILHYGSVSFQLKQRTVEYLVSHLRTILLTSLPPTMYLPDEKEGCGYTISWEIQYGPMQPQEDSLLVTIEELKRQYPEGIR